MVFSSLLFLFRFLPAVLALYYLLPKCCRNTVLFLASLVFYAWGEPVYVVLMIFTTLIAWSHGILVDRFLQRGERKKARAALVSSSVICLALLGFFKYTDFVLNVINDLTGSSIPLLQLALPIGISFYTFQTMSYTIDVYRGEAAVQRNVISFGTYVAMFPQLIAGPIVQYKTVDEQLRTRRETADEFAEGVHRFMIGLGKKVLIANNAGILWDTISQLPAASLPVLTAWIGILAFAFQIYFDFSGYSDMAIGLGHMFGFRFLENFNYPYMSKSITEFWRRWHISLSTWFRDYVYIPLGGNRVGKGRHAFNIMVVWLLTGIWHGASWNFLLWGLYYGVLLLLEKFFLGRLLERLPALLRHVYCIFFVLLGWNLFAFDQLSEGIGYFRALFGGYGQGILNGETIYLLYTNAVLLLIAAVGSFRLPARLAGWVMDRLKRMDWVCIALRGVIYTAIFILAVAYLVDASYNPFLYFRF